ncbi:MAG: flagellar export protein FliJ [Gammaproteobacteria bacterium]|nr:flagellar export protein FliJ [Gammaproteobacteria bacterium]
MKRSKRLTIVSKVMRDREDKVAQILQKAQGAMLLQLRRLEQLEEYRLEYEQRFLAAGGQGVEAQKLLDFRAFMESLGQAIGRQKQIVERHKADYEARKRQWLAAHSKSDAVAGVVASAKHVEEAAAERKNQRDIDDRAARESTKK